MRTSFSISLDINYFVFSGQVTNEAYQSDKIHINILLKGGKISSLTRTSDQGYLKGIQGKVNKHFLCWPR